MCSRQHKLHGMPLTWAWIACPRLPSAESGLSWRDLCEQAGYAATAGACLHWLTQQMHVSLTWPKHQSFLSFVRFIQTKEQFTRSLSSSLENPFSPPMHIAPPFLAIFSFPLCSIFLHWLCNFPLWSALLSLQDNCIFAQILTCPWIVCHYSFFLLIQFFISFQPPSFLLGNMFLLEGKDILVLLKGWDRFASLDIRLRHMWRVAVLNL